MGGREGDGERGGGREREKEREMKEASSLSSFPQIKERCRKGIPPSVRGQAWQQMSGARRLLLANAGLFDVSQPPKQNASIVCVNILQFSHYIALIGSEWLAINLLHQRK